jgi:hypothetical protein
LPSIASGEWGATEEYQALYHERRAKPGLFPPECHEVVMIDIATSGLRGVLQATVWSEDFRGRLQTRLAALLKDRETKSAAVNRFDATLHQMAFPREYAG